MTTLRVCFVGDSITNGTGDTTFLSWPGRLCAAEVESGHDLTEYNLGIRADTSVDVARRWRAECEARLPGDLSCAIVFAFGINDATEEDGVIRVPLAESVTNARSILSKAKALHPTLWIGPTPVDDTRQPLRMETGQVRDKRNHRTADYNLAFRALADDLAVPYLDMMSALINDPGWPAMLSDGLHPMAEGYERMAAIIGSWPAWRNLLD